MRLRHGGERYVGLGPAKHAGHGVSLETLPSRFTPSLNVAPSLPGLPPGKSAPVDSSGSEFNRRIIWRTFNGRGRRCCNLPVESCIFTVR